MEGEWLYTLRGVRLYGFSPPETGAWRAARNDAVRLQTAWSPPATQNAGRLAPTGLAQREAMRTFSVPTRPMPFTETYVAIPKIQDTSAMPFTAGGRPADHAAPARR